jgi:single-strand DNA-binding protein
MCQFIGRVGKNPRIDMVRNGNLRRALFALAVESHWRDAENFKRSHTEWVDMLAWGRMARLVELFVRQGARLYISGRLQTERWDNPEGVRKKRTQVVIMNLTFLDRKKDRAPPPEMVITPEDPVPSEASEEGASEEAEPKED